MDEITIRFKAKQIVIKQGSSVSLKDITEFLDKFDSENLNEWSVVAESVFNTQPYTPITPSNPWQAPFEPIVTYTHKG